jgi:DNA-binding NtrC family response regulator
MIVTANYHDSSLSFIQLSTTSIRFSQFPSRDDLMVTPIAELERKAILSTVALLNGDKLKAARVLGIGKTTLYRKLKEYADNPDQRRSQTVRTEILMLHLFILL